MAAVPGPVGDDEPGNNFSIQEERELRRVYDALCDFHKKALLKAKLNQINGKEGAMDNSTAGGSTDDGGDGEENDFFDDESRHLMAELQALERNPDRKIKAIDLAHAMKKLGRPVNKKTIKNIIWEVDENLDGMVDWDEFQLMFIRNISDRTGLEPSSLYNLVQFMIYDQNENGSVSVDETMNLLYARYGKGRMETKLRELFGEEMKETGTEGGEISFTDYLRAVESTQKRTFVANQDKLSSYK
mmetsp:Transcript_37737/g.118146  ORF Transcript_37737/g.118146 Transcript_37737/m.118146 type:complete len:244 (+) Transcript_37737:294-1025(+)